MSFTQKQLKHIRKIKKHFGKLQQLCEVEESEFSLDVGTAEDEIRGITVAFNQLFIASSSGEERILLTDELICTSETEQQHIFDLVKECLELKEKRM